MIVYMKFLGLTHLKINVSDPFNDTVAGPDHRIQISILTLSTTCLYNLQRCYDKSKLISVFYNITNNTCIL